MTRMFRTGATGALLAAGLIGVAVVGAVRTTATTPIVPAELGVQPAPFETRASAGTLVVRTAPDGKLSLVWNRPDGTTVPVDGPLDASPSKSAKCRVDTAAISGLLDLRVVRFDKQTRTTTPYATPPAVGLVDNGLGSRDQNNCNRGNGRLEAGQAFTIELGSLLPDNVVVDYARLDIEGKFGASIATVATRNGAAVVNGVQTLGNASDNDADAGGADNNNIVVGSNVLLGDGLGTPADDFDRLVIAPVSTDDRGQLSLEGGGDYGTSTNVSVFHLVQLGNFEYTLVCYDGSNGTGTNTDPNGDGTVELITETPDDPDWTFTEAELADTGYPKQARVFRYQGVDGDGNPKPCPPIGAELSAAVAAGVPGVLLELSDEAVNLRVELTWIVPRSVAEQQADSAFDRFIDPDGDGPLPAEPATYCSSFTGDPWNVNSPGAPVHPADTPWCVLTDERTLGQVTVGGEPIDVVFQHMVWDGKGDPKWL